MHGLQTLKYLNEQAAAKAILAKAVKEALASKAKNITQ
jgi:hypothetical protein